MSRSDESYDEAHSAPRGCAALCEIAIFFRPFPSPSPFKGRRAS